MVLWCIVDQDIGIGLFFQYEIEIFGGYVGWDVGMDVFIVEGLVNYLFVEVGFCWGVDGGWVVLEEFYFDFGVVGVGQCMVYVVDVFLQFLL